MVQLSFLSGKLSGKRVSVTRFPWIVGRSNEAHTRIEEPGVWDRHIEISLDLQRGFILTSDERALALVNGHSSSSCVLRNGDIIEAGAVKMQFWLAAARQYSMAWREYAVWAFLTLLCLGQIALVYWLMSL